MVHLRIAGFSGIITNQFLPLQPNCATYFSQLSKLNGKGRTGHAWGILSIIIIFFFQFHPRAFDQPACTWSCLLWVSVTWRTITPVCWSLVILIGPPIPNNSSQKGSNQNMSDALVLQVGVNSRLTTL